mgnify:CR=1 FL=1
MKVRTCSCRSESRTERSYFESATATRTARRLSIADVDPRSRVDDDDDVAIGPVARWTTTTRADVVVYRLERHVTRARAPG